MMFMFFFFKPKAAYEVKECDWSSDVCSSDLAHEAVICTQVVFIRAVHPDTKIATRNNVVFKQISIGIIPITVIGGF